MYILSGVICFMVLYLTDTTGRVYYVCLFLETFLVGCRPTMFVLCFTETFGQALAYYVLGLLCGAS